ncbi:MAG: tetratricopeptide repeat protein [Syntrophobacteraceae bacterium]
MRNPIRKYCLFIIACLIAGLALPLGETAAQGTSESKIKSVRLSVKGHKTRLIFDIEGEKPKQIGPASSDGISVFFAQMVAKIPDKVIQDKASAAKEVKFRREGGFFEVLFREKNTSASSSLQVGRNKRLSLVLELTEPAIKSKPAAAAETKPNTPESRSGAAEAPKEKPPVFEPKKIETSELFSSKVPQSLKSTVQSAVAKHEPEKQPGPKSSGYSEIDEKALNLFRSADEKFDSCSRNLALCGSEIIEAYGEALKAGPKASQAPQALYRTGLAYLTIGNYPKADKTFRQVISEWPEHPITSRCWIGIGDIHNKKQAFLEAMEAFRAALRYASTKEDKAAASFELGKAFLVLGANKEAVEMLNNCTDLDPDYYKKKPETFRLIGEAEFALGMFDKGREHLLRYVNYQQSAPDQDMVLAKLAEIFLNQGDQVLANKMYSFIQKYYTNSEGDLISRIRQAEFIEKSDTKGALKIYDGLCEKDLSPSLRRIVFLKLATLHLKKGTLARSLELMDEAFPAKVENQVNSEMGAMRERILGELVRKYYADKNYVSVIQLHERYRRVFDSIQSPNVLEDIAESYGALKFYSVALEVYDRMLAKGLKKSEDLLLRCALYSLRLNDNSRSFNFCKLVQSDALDLKKSEILGHILYRDQKYQDAAKSFAKIAQKQKDFEISDPDSLHSYGTSLYEVKKYDEAIPVLQKALERMKADDTDSQRSTLVTLSKCFSGLKQYPQAAEAMETALNFTREEQANELLYELSKLHLAAGQPEKAMQSLNRIIGIQHPFWTAVAQQQLNSIQMNQMSLVR